MKIKTKRGARRTRNQRVITRRFVTTRYDGCPYITVGKRYDVIRTNEKFTNIEIMSDINMSIFSLVVGSSHLNDVGRWEWGVL